MSTDQATATSQTPTTVFDENTTMRDLIQLASATGRPLADIVKECAAVQGFSEPTC